MTLIDNLERLLEQGQDTPLMRYGLGNAYFNQGAPAQALPHLAEAVRQDPGYSAAWKLYGKALAATGEHEQAVAVFDRGIAAAEAKGDIQAAKEMRVFRQRSAKALG